jgi:hypothetical protein
MQLLVKELRDLLVGNQNFRQPFLSLPHMLYLHPPTKNHKNINFIRRNPPTDQDVAFYFLCHWPEVRLAEVNAKGQFEALTWGFTHCGAASATDNGIQIMYQLVEHWLNVVCINSYHDIACLIP